MTEKAKAKRMEEVTKRVRTAEREWHACEWGEGIQEKRREDARRKLEEADAAWEAEWQRQGNG